MSNKIYIISGIELPLESPEGEAFVVAKKRLRKAGITGKNIEYRIFRRSIDARRRDSIKFVWSVAAEGEFPDNAKSNSRDVYELASGLPEFAYGNEKLSGRPVIVGSGPAGMFCALLLAEHGYRPIVLERGGDVESRTASVDVFKRSGVLDTESNIQFGAGGAGTFSDGKLVTRVNDECSGYVIDRLLEFGAPEEIRYLAKPHIGTDYLRGIVKSILERICELGGEVRYFTKFENVKLNGTVALSACLAGGNELPLGALVLATGHSSRDTYRSLIGQGFVIEPKPFSVGVRIEHLREDIDRALYGNSAGHPSLGHAEYNLSYDTKTRGVYTFCMCPGGEVVPAASETGGVVVNGMSHHARDGRNSNSAVVVSVFREDYGNTPEGAIAFQENIERRAYKAGGGDYVAPMCTVGDFLDGHATHEPTRVIPTYRDGNVKIAHPKEYLNDFVVKSLERGLTAFGKRIEGFDASDAILTGAETRTSAPVRILRGADRTALGFDNIYPCGEGAGYAGGISSAAIDGIRTAIAIMSKYAPLE